MAGNYGPSGALFVNDRKQAPNHPDYEGKIEFDDELVRCLQEQLRAGETPTLELKGWKKTSKAGKPFLSLAPKVPYKRGTEPTSSRGSGSASRPSDPF